MAEDAYHFLRIGVLVNRQPLRGTGRTLNTPALMARHFGSEYVYILDADSIAGTEHCGNIMGVFHIFQHHRKVGLTFVNYR